MKKFTKLFSLSLAVLFAASSPAFAQSARTMDMVKDLQKQMQQMQDTIKWQNERIIELKKPAGTHYVMPTEGDQVKVPEWLDGFKLKTDLRLRYEARDHHTNEANDRNRFRYRLRVGAEKKFSDEWKAGFRFVSASPGATNSTNTTLGNNATFGYDEVSIDRAYAIYTPNWGKKKGILDKTEIGAGKFANPLKKRTTFLMWDSDVTPEGIYEKFDLKLVDNEDVAIKFSPILGQLTLRETSGRGDHEMFVYSGEVTTKLKESGIKHKAALNYYDVESDFAGVPYHIWEVYNEIGIKVADRPFKVLFDWIKNSEGNAPTNGEHAWVVGTKYGKAKKKGSWQLAYYYAHIGSNSVISGITDSDFGGPNREGHIIKGKYKITDFLTLGLAAFLLDDHAAGPEDKRKMLQADLIWNFG